MYTENNGGSYFNFTAITNLGSIIYTSHQGGSKIYAIGLGNGALKYTNGYVSYDGSNSTQPVAANGYLMSVVGNLYIKCVFAETGNTIWNTNIAYAGNYIRDFIIKDSDGKTYYSSISGMTQ